MTATYVTTFHTTYAACQAQKALMKIGIEAEMVPVPRSISADCAQAVEFRADNEAQARDAIEEMGIEIAAFYCRTPAGKYIRR